MENEPLPAELEQLERRLAAGPRPEPPAALRRQVLRSVRAELRPEQFAPWWRFAAAAAAVIFLWLSLSVAVAEVANSALQEREWNPSVKAIAKKIQRISPEFTPEESLREAVLLQIAAESGSRARAGIACGSVMQASVTHPSRRSRHRRMTPVRTARCRSCGGRTGPAPIRRGRVLLAQRERVCLSRGKNGKGINPMTLDDLIALNDEMAALVRAGVPLESGLAALGADMPARLGQVAAAWAQRTARGEPLEQAVMQDAGSLPPAYRAVVQAGLRAGRLSAALEAVAVSARQLAETQRAVLVAVMYPVLVFLVALGGLVFFTRVVAPPLADMLHSIHVPGHRAIAILARLGPSAWYWGTGIMILVVVLLAAWCHAATRAAALQSRADRLFGWLPWVGPMLRWSRTATFLEILALLVENQMPLEEAVALAGEASGDPVTLSAARQLAATLRQGRVEPAPGEPALPALLTWLMLAARRDGALLPALQHSAAAYHRRARHQADMVRVFLPVLLTVAIGGTVTALYALTLFIPYTTMLCKLSLGMGG